MSIEQVANAVQFSIHKLPHMETLYDQVKDQVDKIQRTRQGLVNDIEERKKKISFLDRIAFSIEQECGRKEQQVQELGDKKNRLEKLIANMVNGEDYSKLMQIVKENVKAILSDNKILISAAFAAIIQTLKTNLQMVNLIYSISSANNGEQYNNSITKYLESNKDNLLDLAEKNYENLVEALTNDVINNAMTSSSNPASPLSSSFSSASSNLFNQSDIYRIEKSESFHHSKGNIDD
jgi:cell division septum initiation protein DivIVA